MLIQFDNSGIAVAAFKAYVSPLVFAEEEAETQATIPQRRFGGGFAPPPIIRGRASVTIEKPSVFGRGRVYIDYSQAIREDEEFMAAFLC